MGRNKTPQTRLSVFKGREAKLNKAIFQTLALKWLSGDVNEDGIVNIARATHILLRLLPLLERQFGGGDNDD